MPDQKPDLSNVRNFMSWALYGLTATIATVSAAAYFDMKSQRNDCQEENNFYARESFKSALQIKVQEKTIKTMDTAITEAATYISDSIQPVNVKNFKGNLKIKRK